MRTLLHFGALFLAAAGALVACSVPDVVFTSDPDAGDSTGDGAEPSEASSPTAMEADAGSPAAEAAAAPPMPPAMPGCPGHPPKGAQGCCGTTPCVGAGCTKQCASCAPCSGQVCCVGAAQGGVDEQKHMNAAISCAPDPASCGGS